MGWQEAMSWPRLVAFMVLVFVLITFAEPFARTAFPDLGRHNAAEEAQKTTVEVEDPTASWCQLPEPLAALSDGLDDSNFFVGEDSLALQIERLSAAVNVSTVSYDDNGEVDKDPRYHTFEELHSLLVQLFPLV